MNAFPIAVREARVLSRRAQTFNLRWIVGLLGLALCLETLLGPTPTAQKSLRVFAMLSMVAQTVALFGGMLYACDAISRERREGTLRLLFLTPLKARDVLAGKFVAAAGTPLACLGALLPLLALPLLMGGISPINIAMMAVHLLNSLFFSLALGFVISSLFTSALVSIAVAGTIAMLLASLPFFAANYGPGGISLLGAISPFHVVFSAIAPGPAGRAPFLRMLVTTHIIAWLLLIVAAQRARRASDGPATIRAEKRQHLFHSLRFGGKKQRARLRQKLLNQNPLAWIANREQVSSAGLIMLCFLLLAVPLVFDPWDNNVIFGYLLAHALVALKIAATAASQLAADRNSGALELLLATPLSVREILSGRARALFRQFFGPGAVLLSLHILSAIFAVLTGPPEFANLGLFVAFFVYAAGAVVLWWALAWIGMWQGLLRKSLLFAIGMTLLQTVLPIYGIFRLMTAILMGMVRISIYSSQPPLILGLFPIETLLFVAAPMLAILYLCAITYWARRKLLNRFREAAVANQAR